jgi:hypothetical protein
MTAGPPDDSQLVGGMQANAGTQFTVNGIDSTARSSPPAAAVPGLSAIVDAVVGW